MRCWHGQLVAGRSRKATLALIVNSSCDGMSKRAILCQLVGKVAGDSMRKWQGCLVSDVRPELEEISWLSAPLRRLTTLVIAFPKTTIGVSLVIAAVCCLMAATSLKFKMSRLDLLSPRSEYNQRWLAYLEEFGDQDDAVVVVQGASQTQVVAVIDVLTETLSAPGKPFQSILAKWDLTSFRSKGLHFAPQESLAELEQKLRSLKPGGNDASMEQLVDNLKRLNDMLDNPKLPTAARSEIASQMQQLVLNLSAALPKNEPGVSAQALQQMDEGLAKFRSHYLLAAEGQMGFLLFRLVAKPGESAPGADAIVLLRSILNEAKQQHPGVEISLTGMPILEFDEMTSSQSDMSRATWLSFVMVALLFWACFGSWKHTLLANAALLIGMAWSLGYITLAVGHLNILTVAFAAILIGIGIDFGIHYIAHYLRFRAHGLPSAEALIETAGDVGPGMVTSGLTTALAFCTAALTEFVGIAELGVIAGGGIMLCVIAAATVLPAMIQLFDRNETHHDAPKILQVSKWSAPAWWFPKATMGAVALATLVISFGVINVRYDHNLLNLQAGQLESVKVEREVLSKGDQSFWSALSIADNPAHARQLRDELSKLESVAYVEEVASLLPEADPAARESIVRISALLDKLPAHATNDVGDGMRNLMVEIVRAERSVSMIDPQNAALAGLSQVREQLMGLASPNGGDLAAILPRLVSLRAMCEPEPPKVADLPKPIADRFIGRTGKHLIRIHAKGHIWDMAALERFVTDVESIDAKVTGHPVQTFYASRHMQRSYLQASMYSLIAVAAVIMLDFQSIRLTALAMTPLLFGVLQMIGLMGWFNIPFNPANMIALPLILGMGVEDGVHLVHEFRRMKHRFWLTDSTAMAVMLTSSTTMASFACLIVSRHQGLRTLGQVLTIGVFTCLAVALLGLVGLLRYLTRHLPVELPQTIVATPIAPAAIATPTPDDVVETVRIQPRRRRTSIDFLGDDSRAA